MSDMMQFFRANPGAMIMTGLVGMGVLVFGGMGALMARSGVSLKPLVFVGGFFAIVVLPQAAFHYAQALGWIPRKDLVWTPGGNNAPQQWSVREDILEIAGGRFAEPVAVYGPDVDTMLISDLRTRLPDIFGKAQAAEMAVLRTMSTVVLAHFEGAAAAEQGLRNYAVAMMGALPPIDADGTYTVQRANDVVKLLVAGRTLVAYSAPDSSAVRTLLASSPVVQVGESTPQQAEPEFWLYRVPVLISLTLALLTIAVLWFFRMSAWAVEVPPAANSVPASPGELRERLMGINAMDVPFRIEAAPGNPTQLIATWRYADAKWMDLARVRGMRRTHRIILNIDEKDGTVRPTEQFSLIDWSAGAGGAQLRWATAHGMTFFQYEHERVFGLQFDSTFRFTPKLSYAYTFNLQEMKAPLIQAVTMSGWRWRPVMLHGPRWLSWLTD